MKKLIALFLALITVLMFGAPVVISADELTGDALLASLGLTANGYNGGVTSAVSVTRDAAGRLVVKAGPETATEQINLYLSADLPNDVKGLSSYTVEAKIMPIEIGRNAQNGISLNSDNRTVVTNLYGQSILVYNAGADVGQVLCRRITGGVYGSSSLGMGNLASMSAAWYTENVLAMTYDGVAKKLAYKVNGVQLVEETVTAEQFSLSSFNIVIPANMTLAISYMRVYDGNGTLVLNKEFNNVAENAPERSLTVNYVYENGEKAAESVVRNVKQGEYYSIASPTIEGYSATATSVTGAMGDQDLTLTVTYKKLYKLTIHYVDEFGNVMMNDYVEELNAGDSYSVDVFEVANYVADQAKIEGTITNQNIEVVVKFVRKSHHLTIKYQYEDGTTAHEDYVEDIKHGEQYSIDSPVIDGFVANKKTVSDNRITKDAEIVVVYSAVAGNTDNNVADTTAESNTEIVTDTPSVSEAGCGSMVSLFTILPILMGGAFFVNRKKED